MLLLHRSEILSEQTHKTESDSEIAKIKYLFRHNI